MQIKWKKQLFTKLFLFHNHSGYQSCISFYSNTNCYCSRWVMEGDLSQLSLGDRSPVYHWANAKRQATTNTQLVLEANLESPIKPTHRTVGVSPRTHKEHIHTEECGNHLAEVMALNTTSPHCQPWNELHLEIIMYINVNYVSLEYSVFAMDNTWMKDLFLLLYCTPPCFIKKTPKKQDTV